MDISKIVNSQLSQLKEYTPGRSIASVKQAYGLSSIIKLASNENPYGPAVTVDDLAEDIKSLQLYPDIFVSGLREDLAEHLKREGAELQTIEVPQTGASSSEKSDSNKPAQSIDISPENIILGNGSDEILQMLAICFLRPNDEVLTVNHTFSVYKFVTTLSQAQFKTVDLNNFAYDIDAIVNGISDKTRMVFIANPNNPTGSILTQVEIKAILKKLTNGILVLDQAYAEFATDPAYCNGLSLIQEHNNICVLQTFSKLYGLAGLRIGYGVGHHDLISKLNKLRMPFNVNGLALTAAKKALKNTLFIEKTLQNNETEKERLYKALEKLNLAYVPSQANFVTFHGDFDAMEIYEKFLQKGIILRPLNSFGIPNGIRVTIGTHEQMSLFIKELHTIFHKGD